MDLSALGSVLQTALSANPEERKGAEAKLEQFKHSPGLLWGLMQIVARAEVDISNRQIASIYFKNLVSKDWDPEDEKPQVFPAEDKAVIRENIVEAIIHSPPNIRVQLQECLRVIVRSDYPENWPQLLSVIQANLQSRDQQRTYGALVALRSLARKYEFSSDEDRDHLYLIVDATFPMLIEIFKHLISIPSPDKDIADLSKLICKIFSSTIYLEIPEKIQGEAVFLEWMSCLFSVLEKPILPDTQNPEAIKSNPWWKVKKWALSIVNRMYSRYGDSKLLKGNLKEFSAMLSKNGVPQKFLGLYLNLIFSLRSGAYLPERITNLCLQFLTQCVGKVSEYKALKPHFPGLIYEVIYPLLCFNDSDQQLWTEDPNEYIRKGYDVFEDMYSPRTAAMNFLVDLMRKRGKENLDTFVQFLNSVFVRYDQSPPEAKPYREKDGALMAIGALSAKLKKTEPYKSQLEFMLARHVFPEFVSPMPYLRAKAAWVSGMYVDIEFKEQQNFDGALGAIVRALKDPELPVRVDSVVALRSFIECVNDLSQLRPILPMLLDEFFKLMNEVENEDLVFTLETIVERFGEEIEPYAFGLITNLAQAFWKCYKGDNEAEEEDETSILAAMGCLRAICTILESVHALPQIYEQLEPTLLPIMQKMISEEGQDVFEEVMDIISYYTYYSPNISLQMWSLWPSILTQLDSWAIDFFDDALGPLDNYIARSTEHFLTCPSPNYPQSLFNFLSKILSSEVLDDDSVKPAPKLMDTVLQNCRGRVDSWVEPYLLLCINRLQRTDNSYLKDLLIVVVASALYYNAALTVSILHKHGLVSSVFQQWLQMVYKHRKSGKAVHFRREHDKKMCVLGLSSLFLLPAGSAPADIIHGLPDVSKAVLKLLIAFKQQQEDGVKAEEEEEEEYENPDSDSEDSEDADEDHSAQLEDSSKLDGVKLAAKAKQWLDREEEEDSASDFTDDDEFQCAVDDIDPFVYFSDVMQGVSGSDPPTFQAVMASLDAQQQAWVQTVTEAANEKRKQ